MAKVNNATGVYATLGYNFDDPNDYVIDLSANTQAHLNVMPAVITTWQAQDIANNVVGGYFQNPVVSYINTIITVSDSIYALANGSANVQESGFSGTANLYGIAIAANAVTVTANSFLYHTNKISGVTPIIGQDDTLTQPYYDSATTYGKTVIYITNQTDGIINNSPILGSLTSILVGPQLSANANTLSADLIILSNGISANTLTSDQANTIISDLNICNSLMTTRRNSDLTFFQNLVNLVNQYNATKSIATSGETEKYLLNNFVGTDKTKERINS